MLLIRNHSVGDIVLRGFCARSSQCIAGGHPPGSPALQLLEWQLSGAVVASLAPALQGGPADSSSSADAHAAAAQRSRTALGQALSERGVLQLLFDTQLLRTSLAGGRPAGSAGVAMTQLRCALLPDNLRVLDSHRPWYRRAAAAG